MTRPHKLWSFDRPECVRGSQVMSSEPWPLSSELWLWEPKCGISMTKICLYTNTFRSSLVGAPTFLSSSHRIVYCPILPYAISSHPVSIETTIGHKSFLGGFWLIWAGFGNLGGLGSTGAFFIVMSGRKGRQHGTNLVPPVEPTLLKIRFQNWLIDWKYKCLEIGFWRDVDWWFFLVLGVVKWIQVGTKSDQTSMSASKGRCWKKILKINWLVVGCKVTSDMIW